MHEETHVLRAKTIIKHNYV